MCNVPVDIPRNLFCLLKEKEKICINFRIYSILVEENNLENKYLTWWASVRFIGQVHSCVGLSEQAVFLSTNTSLLLKLNFCMIYPTTTNSPQFSHHGNFLQNFYKFLITP